MQDRIVATAVGGALFVAGLVLMSWHLRNWRSRRDDPDLDDEERRFFRARFRRRMQTSGLLALLGILLPVGDYIPWEKAPGLFTIYWGGVLLLLVWVILLAVGDMLSTGAHSRASLSRIREEQRKLREELHRLRARKSNGRSTPDSTTERQNE